MSKAKECIIVIFNYVMGSFYVGVLTEDLDNRSLTEIVKKWLELAVQKKYNTKSFF